MARVHLTSTYLGHENADPWHLGPYEMLKTSAMAGNCHHMLTDSPDEADIILYCDGGPRYVLRSILTCPVYQQHWRRCFVFDPDDHPAAVLPGIYASIEKSWHDPRWTKGGVYLHINERHRFSYQPYPSEPRYLASFTGSVCNAPVRAQIALLASPAIRIEDTSGRVIPAFSTGDASAIESLTQNYVQTVRESAFVLCPRGEGASSLRLFEVMRMGRCPVILSDEWVPPDGPDWNSFAIRVPESQAPNLPQLLANRQSNAKELGLLARKNWERWFSDEAVFGTVVDWCLQLAESGHCSNPLFRLSKLSQLFKPISFRRLLRSF